jgi:hypothetical protein
VQVLESRLVPAVLFDQGTGLLSVTGDELGPANDVLQAAVTANNFVEVTINGTVHSSDPGSANFDAALDGATASTVLAIGIQGLEGDDTITLGDGFTAAGGRSPRNSPVNPL